MTEDEILANIPTVEEIANINNLYMASSLTDHFLKKIELSVQLTFNNTCIKTYFYDFYDTSPIPELPYTGDFFSNVCDDIGFAFTVFYKLLNSYTEILQDFRLLGDASNVFLDLCLLKTAIFSLDNAAKTPDALMDELSLFTSSKMGPIYGVRSVEGANSVGSKDSLMQYINCIEPDYKRFLGSLQNGMRYTYRCENLYQICGAILDYLCHYRRHDDYATKPHTLSLRQCPRCGRYFTTEDRKIIYCQYADEQGKTCADWQEAERKKKLAQIPKNNADQLAEKIRCRLYSYRNAIKTSREDHTNDPRFVDRDNLYKLYLKCRKKYSKSPNFDTWIAECAAQLPKSRNESYDKFKKWLQERS